MIYITPYKSYMKYTSPWGEKFEEARTDDESTDAKHVH